VGSLLLNDVGLLELTDDSEWLHRQVSPSWLVDGGRPSSQTWKPTPKDGGELSVYRGSVFVDAKSAFDFHCSTLGLRSVGVAGVTVRDVREAGTKVFDDSARGDVSKGHSFVDFREMSKKEQKLVQGALQERALRHGWRYGPVASG
jgi:hypothetical protein